MESSAASIPAPSSARVTSEKPRRTSRTAAYIASESAATAATVFPTALASTTKLGRNATSAGISRCSVRRCGNSSRAVSAASQTAASPNSTEASRAANNCASMDAPATKGCVSAATA